MLVTGGASGIGKAAAERFVKEGAQVIIFDNQEKKGKEVANELGAIFFHVDVADPTGVKDAIVKAVNKYDDKLDIAFINAGINGKVTTIEDMSFLDWRTTINVNLTSTFLCLKNVIPFMKENGGSVIITSSVNGSRDFSNIGMSAYATSKAGQIAFGKMAALELSKYKIRVNMVCPGAIDTNIGQSTKREDKKLKEVQIPVEYPEGSHPLAGGKGKPEQVADLVCFLASDLSSHITGTPIYIDGAETLL